MIGMSVYGRGKELNKQETQNIKKPFISEENKKKIKDRIITDISTLFDTEEKKRMKEIRAKKKLMKD